MDPTAIAVLATLTGIALTSLTTLAATVLVQRHQERLARQQHDLEQLRARRQELRAAFVSFLEAYDAAFARSAFTLTSTDNHSDEPDRAWRTIARDEMTRLQQAYLVVCITADQPVRDAANASLGTIWSLGTAAAAGDVVQYEHLRDESKQPRDHLREAMRDQLGVT
jgi:hypothetical protein